MTIGSLQRWTWACAAAVLLLSPRLSWAGAGEVQDLITKLVNGSIGDQNRAMNRLNYLGPDVAGPYLKELLASPEAHNRIAASSALVLVHYRGAESALVDVLSHDEDWEVRRNAVNALAGIHATRTTRLIAKTLRSDPQAKVRKACVTALSTLGGGATALAASAVHDNEIEVRLAALDALAHTMDRTTGPVLRPLLEDPSGLVRFAAARSLGWQGDAVGRKFLTDAVGSKESENVRRGVTALSDVPSDWATELLARTMESSDERAGCDAAAALARRADPRGTRQLMKISTSGGPQADRAQQWLDQLGQGK